MHKSARQKIVRFIKDNDLFPELIENNYSTTYGGGIDARKNDGRLVINGGIIRNNEAEGEGKNIYPETIDYYIKGDIDGDEDITIMDVRLLLQSYINAKEGTVWDDTKLRMMDMNEDNIIDVIDIRKLFQIYRNS